MITINLKPGAKRAAPKGSPLVAWRARVANLRNGVEQPMLILAGAAWVVMLVGVGGMYWHTRGRLNTLEPRMTATQDEFKRYRNFVMVKKREARAKDSILAQIGTLSAVDQDRYTWSHILDEVAGALPEYTWLTSISPVAAGTTPTFDTDTTVAPPVSVIIAGQTSDLQNYTSFLRRLGDSRWLVNVTPVKTETIIDKANRPVTSFTVQATFSRGDSTRMQMVPINESTVR